MENEGEKTLLTYTGNSVAQCQVAQAQADVEGASTGYSRLADTLIIAEL